MFKKINIIVLTLLIFLLIGCKNTNKSNDEVANDIINSINVSVNNEVVIEDFTVPGGVVYDNVRYLINWESKDENLLTFVSNGFSYDAKIVREDKDNKVSFTASITYEEIVKTKEFSVTIGKLDSEASTGDLPSDVTYTGYYADMTGMFGSYDDFFNTLNDILVSTHTNHLSYSDVWTVLQESDAYDSEHIECFYTGMLIDKDARDGSGNTDSGYVWNREHVWAKSHGFNDDKYTAYSDAHHLRASEKTINSSRNNSYFAEVTNPTGTDEYGNKWTSSVFEPRDEVKGDVARILFYMVTRYHDSELTLTLDNTGNYGNEPTLGMLDTLVKWHYEDPVSETEIKRNEVVYQYQGNRNPYIDHPEFVYYLYQDESKALGITESNVLEKVESKEEIEDTTVTDLINDIEVLRDKTITLEDKELLDSLELRYNNLSSADKTKVTNYDLLQEKQREYDSLLGIDVNVYDLMKFPSTGTSYSKDGVSQEIDGVTFFASNYSTKDKEFLLGANTSSYKAPDNKYNVGNWSKFSVLVFSVSNLKEISFDVGNINKGFDNCYLIYSSDNVNYEIVDELNCVTGENTFYDFSNTKSGYFGIVVVGSQARVIIMNFTLSYVN